MMKNVHKMWWDAFVITLGFGLLFISCHGQQDDFLQTLKNLVRLLNATESHMEQMFTRMEKLNKNLEKSDQRLIEKMLGQTQVKLWTKLEAVEKEMRDRSTCTTVENTLREGFANAIDRQQAAVEWMEKNLTEIQSQMLQMKDELIQRFEEFVDHYGHNQSEAIADRLREEWTNFSRGLFSEVLDLHRPTINASNLDTIAHTQGCHQLFKEGVTSDGVYQLHLEGQQFPFSAYCDMTEDGGGWTVIMRRGEDYGNNSRDFYRNWYQYRNGFGNLEQQFWLGNEKIHALTSTGECQLLVILKTHDGDFLRITYDAFTVDSENRKYAIFIGGEDLPKEGGAQQAHIGFFFSTSDGDNGFTIHVSNCVRLLQAEWVSGDCFTVSLTGSSYSKDSFIMWDTWKNGTHLKGAEMKIRPKNFK